MIGTLGHFLLQAAILACPTGLKGPCPVMVCVWSVAKESTKSEILHTEMNPLSVLLCLNLYGQVAPSCCLERGKGPYVREIVGWVVRAAAQRQIGEVIVVCLREEPRPFHFEYLQIQNCIL